jgi:hypothetical protein
MSYDSGHPASITRADTEVTAQGSRTRSEPQPGAAAERRRARALKAAETRRRNRLAIERKEWEQWLAVLIHQPPDDLNFWSLDCPVRDGDVEAALEEVIACVLKAMSPPSPYEIECLLREGITDTRPLSCDVALVFRGRILAVVRYSPDGGIVHRFDRN